MDAVEFFKQKKRGRTLTQGMVEEVLAQQTLSETTVPKVFSKSKRKRNLN